MVLQILGVTNKRTVKLIGDHRFECPKGYTNDQKALKIIFELVEQGKTRCLSFQKTIKSPYKDPCGTTKS